MKAWTAFRNSRAPGVVLLALLLVTWQLSATYWFKSPTWPTVTRIFEAWFENIADGTIPGHLIATLWRQMLGYGLAVVIGIMLGLVMGYYRLLYNLFEPLVEVLRPIPGPAYLPILVLFVGIGHEMKVTLIHPIAMEEGLRFQFDTARTLGLTTLQTFRELVIPAASPQILTGMRISLAISLILAILGEMIVSNDGLGYFVLLSQRTFKVPDMYAGIFTLALLGYVLNRLFLIIESRLIRWHTESSGRT